MVFRSMTGIHGFYDTCFYDDFSHKMLMVFLLFRNYFRLRFSYSYLLWRFRVSLAVCDHWSFLMTNFIDSFLCSIFSLVPWPLVGQFVHSVQHVPLFICSLLVMVSSEVMMLPLEIEGLQVIDCPRPPWKYGHENNSCGQPMKRNCIKVACLSLTSPGTLEHYKRSQIDV